MLAIEHWSPHEAVLPLSPCNLAIERAGWADRDSEAARLGLTAQAPTALLVVHGGLLDMDWSLKGRHVNQDAVSFEIELPSCPSSQFLLTVPEDRIPVVSTGIMTRQKSPEEGTAIWQIDLGGQNRFSLRIGPRDDPEGHKQSTELRQKSIYRLSPAGLEATVVLRFDILGQQPLSRLELEVAPGLNLVSVQEGDNVVAWGETPIPGASAKRIVIEPDSPLVGLGRELTLKALGPVCLEKPWRLPGMTVSGVRWCESVATVISQHPLRLNDITLERGRIAQVRPRQSQTATDTVELQLFSATAPIDVVLGQQQTPPQVEYGVTIEMSGGQIAGHQTVRLETDEGERFQIVGELGRSWVVDSVNTSGTLADWRIEPKGRTKRQLVIDLTEPLTSDVPIWLDIRARRLESTEGRRYSSRDVIPVEFESCRLETGLVALHALEPYQVELSGTDSLELREVQNLSVKETQLFPQKPQGKIYVHDGGDERLGIRIKPRRSLYSAEIDVSVSVSGMQVTEDYTFRIHPESVRLENLVVEILDRSQAPLRWEPAVGGETYLDAEDSGSSQEGSTRLKRWNLRLRPSRSETFEIRARRFFSVEDGMAIGLARLPDAAQQKGRLSVGVYGEGHVRIENRGLVPEVAVPQLKTGEIPQAVFRYNPRRSLVSGKPPIVLRVDTARPNLPRLCVWRCQLESRLEPTGRGQHVATYQVENSGASVIRFSLPMSIGIDLIESVEIDGRRAPLESGPLGNPPELAVRLDGVQRFREVAICYRTEGFFWSPLQKVEIPLPDPECPVLKRDWIVWLPPGRQMIEPGSMFTLSNSASKWPGTVWGPLKRKVSSEPADPLRPDWWSWGKRGESAPVVSSASSPAGGATGFPPANWGEFLNGEPFSTIWKDQYLENGKLGLLLDVNAVAELGISPRTGITLAEGCNTTEQVVRLLGQAGLALALSNHHVLLTSMTEAAAHGERLKHDETGTLWRVTDVAWSNEIDQVISDASPTLVTAAEWKDLPLADTLPWTKVFKPGYGPRDTLGWTVRKIDLSAVTTPSTIVVDRNLLFSGLWFFFLFVTFFTWMIALRHSPLAFLLIAGFLLAGAYLSEFWAIWGSAGFWGTCCGLAIRLVSVRRSSSPGRVLATRAVSDSAAIGGSVCLAVLLFAAQAFAQVPTQETSLRSPALILAPVGEDGKPTGKKYSVPESFYFKLQQRAQEIAEETPGWLLKEAYYHGSLSWQATGKPLTVTEFTAEFGVEVIRAKEPVEIPLGRTVENWTPQAVLLDGGQVDHVWDPSGKLIFYPPEPAQSSRLTLKLVPIPVYGIEPNGFHLDIPPLATSRLELSIPAGVPRVEVPSATGRIRQQPLKLEADLGPVDQLVVTWQPTSRTSGGKVTRVDELLWLNLSLGGAILDGRFRFDLGQDFDGELRLEHDPRLVQRVIEVEGATLDDVRIEQDSSDSSPSQALTRERLSLTDPGPTVTVRVQYVVRDASGIGNLRLPDLRTAGCEVARRWAAATIDPKLHIEQATQGTIQKISASDFVDEWGGEVDVPTVAFQLDGETASFALTTYPEPAKSSSQWELDVHYGLEETLLQYRANVDTSDGCLFCHRMTVPPSLQIDEVTAAVNDIPCTIRWARPDSKQPQRLVLFFDVPVRGNHSIQLKGRIDARGERSEPLELVGLQEVEGEAGTINIYRDPEVIVELESVKGMTKVAERLGPILMRWVVDDLGSPSATAHVMSNDLEVLAHEQVISLRQVPEGWQVDVDCDLEVASGMLDRIYLECSELWPGPYTVSAGVTEEPVRGERGELVLRVPPRERFKFRVSGPLAPKPGGRISVPRIRLKNIEYTDQTSRLVVLPAGPAPAIRWDVLGLTLTDVPTQFVSKAPGLTWNAYRVQQDDFLATIRPGPNAAKIHLVDMHLAWDGSGECRGVALYDLEAGDRDSCVLNMPEPWRLVAVSNHGTPASPQLGEDGSWVIPLGRTALPQRLEVLFTGSISHDEGGGRIDTFPELVDLPIQRTLWTFAGDGDFKVIGAGEQVRRDEVVMERLRNVTALLSPANRRSSSSLDEDETWYRGWLGEWVRARREAAIAIAIAERTNSVRAEKAELVALDAAQRASAEQFDSADLMRQLTDSSPSRVPRGSLWNRDELGMVSKYYCMNGGSARPVLRIASSRTEQGAQFLFSPVLYVAGGLLVLLVAWATGQFHRWPHLFGVACGLVWWLWFWPSVVGLVFVGAFLITSVRSGWRRPRSSGSAIVRLSVSGRS